MINRRNLSRLRTEVKKFRRLLDQENLADAQKMLAQLYRVIDRSSQKGVIRSNTAARYKSRLTRHLSVLARSSVGNPRKGASEPAI